MTRAATPRFAGTLAVVVGSWVAAVATGRVELLVLAVPFALSVAWSLCAEPDAPFEAAVTLESDRCLEGDPVDASIVLTCAEALPDVLVGLGLPPGSEAPHGAVRSGAVARGDAFETTVTFAPRSWGLHRVGPVVLRSYAPGRLFYRERIQPHAARLEVYPGFERTRRAIVPPRSQVFTGNWVSRVTGEGIEFAEVRSFVPGDRIRSVNWRASSRRPVLAVNVSHQERNADVVILIDTFASFGRRGRTSLDLSVRAAAGLALHYLAHRDRVGLVTFGGMVHWLTVATGERQLHRIIEYLLKVNATTSYAWKDLDSLPYRTLPPQAFVIACSPLVDARTLRAIVDLDARGYPVAVLDTLPEEDVEPGDSEEDALAYRVWRLVREGTRDDLTSRGIPVSTWTGGEDLEAALVRFPRRRVRVVRR